VHRGIPSLPFLDHSCDTHDPGVEHFEGGSLPALREAHRVVRPGRVLLVSVPYLSPLRRASALWRSDRFAQGPSRDTTGRGEVFWQYAFGVPEFKRLLLEASFRVEHTLPYRSSSVLMICWYCRPPGAPAANASRVRRLNPRRCRPPQGSLAPEAADRIRRPQHPRGWWSDRNRLPFLRQHDDVRLQEIGTDHGIPYAARHRDQMTRESLLSGLVMASFSL
jgi:SAM-dependent methyltransferase